MTLMCQITMITVFTIVINEKIYMEYEEEITFNDIPRVMANILRKCDLLEQSIDQ